MNEVLAEQADACIDGGAQFSDHDRKQHENVKRMHDDMIIFGVAVDLL